MGEVEARVAEVAAMPRGGPGAPWWDRVFQTEELEYLDRDDVPDEIKQKVIGMLDRLGTQFNLHEKCARAALQAVADLPDPRILELGAGHGQLSAKILELHPTATLTVSDVDPTSVANIAASPLGRDRRVRTEVIDATAIDADDDSYDLVVFAQAFHHLPPAVACRAIREATRVGTRLFINDLQRQAPWALAMFSVVKPLLQLVVRPWSSLPPLLHDGYISALRAYSPSALQALARAADPGLRIEFFSATTGFGPPSFNAVITRSAGDDGQRSG